jgi:hypothetical protein
VPHIAGKLLDAAKTRGDMVVLESVANQRANLSDVGWLVVCSLDLVIDGGDRVVNLYFWRFAKLVRRGLW